MMSHLVSAVNAVLFLFCLLLVPRNSLATGENSPSADEIYHQFAYPEKLHAKQPATPVLLFLIDSLRWDIFERYRRHTNQELPGFSKLKAVGGHVERVAPVFPAECYPNLLSIITGKYPEEHRLLFTTMYDESQNRSFTFDGRSHHQSQADRIALGDLWNPEDQVSCFHRKRILSIIIDLY
ncbi:unnamed protein product [Echinostoma caproni]|uniref:Choline-specific glycerophosphodiester phosphodiesterase n=1 Tax=Echinostoma caproni TaxID=27848 RepID=A0A183B0N4_9TREM|nr:unnamed protein product [Echinostoma caproni]